MVNNFQQMLSKHGTNCHSTDFHPKKPAVGHQPSPGIHAMHTSLSGTGCFPHLASKSKSIDCAIAVFLLKVSCRDSFVFHLIPNPHDTEQGPQPFKYSDDLKTCRENHLCHPLTNWRTCRVEKFLSSAFLHSSCLTVLPGSCRGDRRLFFGGKIF